MLNLKIVMLTNLLSQNSDFNYAFIDASTAISLYQVLAAVHNSIRNYKENELQTKNINSEIVYSLSPTSTIIDAFDRFGITDKTESLIIVKINGEEEQIKKELEKIVNGTELEPNDFNIKRICDMTKIRMNYKLDKERYNDLGKIKIFWSKKLLILILMNIYCLK
ncbi:unnamed protein product [Pneumocystis jirovecii]|uniref:EKC/KEOPS complex subunit CGI121 n=1 Tax=Pneumocystis jirovecii TaxID=42068 RepID=L0P9R4_PNEJI|nr:unnamed protein product [Pneumocystis jirovecii]